MLVSLAAGAALLVAFVVQERRTETPMLPMEFFARRGFAVTNVVSLAMYFGMFGSIFFLSQFLQNVLGNTPAAGRRQAAGLDRGDDDRLAAGGLLLRALRQPGCSWPPGWACRRSRSAGWPLEPACDMSYASMIVPFVLGGAGMALVFAPSANAVLASVRSDQAGQASGATNAIRELGGVLGIAVLATVFTSHGGYASPQAFVNGLMPAMWVGTAVLAVGALIPLLLPFSTRASAEAQASVEAAERAQVAHAGAPALVAEAA